MDSMRIAVLCACMTAAALTLAEGVLPMTRFQKQIRPIFTCLLLISILRPLTHTTLTAPEIRPESEISDHLTAAAEEARCNAIAACVQNGLQQSLDARGVDCQILRVIVHISEDGGIGIDEVTIKGNIYTGTVYLREWLGSEILIHSAEEDLP